MRTHIQESARRISLTYHHNIFLFDVWVGSFCRILYATNSAACVPPNVDQQLVQTQPTWPLDSLGNPFVVAPNAGCPPCGNQPDNNNSNHNNKNNCSCCSIPHGLECIRTPISDTIPYFYNTFALINVVCCYCGITQFISILGNGATPRSYMVRGEIYNNKQIACCILYPKINSSKIRFSCIKCRTTSRAPLTPCPTRFVTPCSHLCPHSPNRLINNISETSHAKWTTAVDASATPTLTRPPSWCNAITRNGHHSWRRGVLGELSFLRNCGSMHRQLEREHLFVLIADCARIV